MKNNGRAPGGRSQIICVRRAIQLRAPLLTGASACKRPIHERRSAPRIGLRLYRGEEDKRRERSAPLFRPVAQSAPHFRFAGNRATVIQVGRTLIARHTSSQALQTAAFFGVWGTIKQVVWTRGEVRSRGCQCETPDSSNDFYQGDRSERQASDMGGPRIGAVRERVIIEALRICKTPAGRSSDWQGHVT